MLLPKEDKKDYDYFVGGPNTSLSIRNVITETLQDALHHVSNHKQIDSGFGQLDFFNLNLIYRLRNYVEDVHQAKS